MKETLENPFLGAGSIVHGERFRGRKEARNVIKEFLRPILTTQTNDCLAIVGVRSIGKSSLVYETIRELKEQLIDRKIIPIRINLSEFPIETESDQSSIFFRSIVAECINEMNYLNVSIPSEIQSTADQNTAPRDKVKPFFKCVKDAGYTALFVLDNFDSARHIFKGNGAFQSLRDLMYFSDYGFSLVLISCRTIREIEHQANSFSPFHNSFSDPLNLGMLNDEDLENYFSLLSSTGISIDEATKKRILFYCGAHPYLLEGIGQKIVDQFNQTGKINVDEAADAILDHVFSYYKVLVDFLKDIGSFDKLLQILFCGASPNAQDRLEHYDLIKNQGNSYVAYSKHFQDYLEALQADSTLGSQITRESESGSVDSDTRLPEHGQDTALTYSDTDLREIWAATEKALRELIITIMSDNYGQNWIHEHKGIIQISTTFDSEYLKRKQLAIERFGPNAGSAEYMLDYTFTEDLFQIIAVKSFWETHFKQIFKVNEYQWRATKDTIVKYRNAVTHNYQHHLHQGDRTLFVGYCQQIQNNITNYNNQVKS